MNGEIQVRRRHNVRRLAFVTIAAAAVFLLLKPETASGDGQHSPATPGTPVRKPARIPEGAPAQTTLQRIVRRLVAAGAPGAVAFVRAPGRAVGVARLLRETGAFGAGIYFRAQVFHRICTRRRHLFHSLK